MSSSRCRFHNKNQAIFEANLRNKLISIFPALDKQQLSSAQTFEFFESPESVRQLVYVACLIAENDPVDKTVVELCLLRKCVPPHR